MKRLHRLQTALERQARMSTSDEEDDQIAGRLLVVWRKIERHRHAARARLIG